MDGGNAGNAWSNWQCYALSIRVKREILPSCHTGECQYDVHGCTNVAVIWISKSDPVNTRHHYSFLSIGFALYGEYLLFKKKLRRKPFPRYRVLRIPSQIHDFLRSRKQGFLSWFRSFERPVQMPLKSFTY